MGDKLQLHRVKALFNPLKGPSILLVLAFSIACGVLAGCGQQEQTRTLPDFETDRVRILQRMEAQEAAWNRGDLDGFMEAYWRSDSLLFVGSRGPTRGWQTTLDNYRKGYPSPAEMGQLTFGVQSLEPAGAQHALMLGSWQLDRSGDLDTLAGWFSLVWQRLDGDWVIIRDHSS